MKQLFEVSRNDDAWNEKMLYEVKPLSFSIVLKM